MKSSLVFGFLIGAIPALFGTGASATLLFAGGEDTDFTCNDGGTCSVDTAGGHFRAGWAREAYRVMGVVGNPPDNRFSTPIFTPSNSLWVHAQYCNDSCGGLFTVANSQMLRLIDDAGRPSIIVYGTGTLGQLKISSMTSSGAIRDLVTCSSALSLGLSQFDMFVNYNTTGEIGLYKNGTKVCEFSGDTTNGDGATTVNQIEFASASAYYGGGGHYSSWSEVIVATTDTRSMSRFSALTVANGNTVDFLGTNICSSIWRATAFNDANYGYTDNANATHECTINAAIPPGAYSVIGLVMSTRALVGTSGPQHFDFVTRIGGSDYTSPDFAPTTGFTNLGNYIQSTNPATGSPWSVTDFTTAGFNVGEMTKP